MYYGTSTSSRVYICRQMSEMKGKRLRDDI